ncbi:MAG: sulfoxide reductase heme-binding subunit YedZ, partial [Alphaproteobacteria bacterium]
MTYADLAPWADRAGRFSALRAAAFLGASAPGAYAIWALASGSMGPEPEEAATHFTGEWTLYLLLATLAIAPLRRIPGWGRLATLRRMFGLAAFGYVAAHFLMFVLDLDGAISKVATEIAT